MANPQHQLHLCYNSSGQLGHLTHYCTPDHDFFISLWNFQLEQKYYLLLPTLGAMKLIPSFVARHMSISLFLGAPKRSTATPSMEWACTDISRPRLQPQPDIGRLGDSTWDSAGPPGQCWCESCRVLPSAPQKYQRDCFRSAGWWIWGMWQVCKKYSL